MDTTRPFLRPSELVELVKAIVGASPSDELDWIEWKSQIDLSGTPGRGTAARHVLGLANRHPVRSLERARGYGYLVMGAEPGAPKGIEALDPADLEQCLEPFLGTAGPQWTANWVAYEHAEVLVITVPPPEWGDPIHPLRRQFAKDTKGGTYLEGTVFVRRVGRTVQAGAAELEMLQERLLRRSQRVDVTLEWAAGSPDFHCVDCEPIEAFVASERATLLAPLTPQPPREPIKVFGTGTRTGLNLAELRDMEGREAAGQELSTHEREDLNATRAAISVSWAKAAAAFTLTGPEARTREDYEREVEGYTRDITTWLVASTLQRMVRDGRNRLRLRLRNLTDRNFTAIEVTVSVVGRVFGLETKDLKIARPSKPLIFGMASAWAKNLAAPSLSGLGIASLVAGTHAGPPAPRSQIDNSASATIRFLPVDLRPAGVADLDTRILLNVARGLAGSEIELRWTATAADADGVVEGTLRAPVSEHSVEPEIPDGDDDS